MKNLSRVVLGSVASALLGAASFFAVEGLMPTTAEAQIYANPANSYSTIGGTTMGPMALATTPLGARLTALMALAVQALGIDLLQLSNAPHRVAFPAGWLLCHHLGGHRFHPPDFCIVSQASMALWRSKRLTTG